MAVLVASIAATLTTAPSSAATSAALFSLHVTPTQDLTDGAQMTVTITRTDAGATAGLEITWVAFAWCAPTFTQPTNVPTTKPSTPPTSQFPTRWQLAGTHCTTKAHPLNGDILPQTVIAPEANSSGDYTTVTGHVAAQTSEGTKLYTPTTHTLTGFDLVCDPTHPCRFAVAVFTRHAGTLAQEPAIFLSVPVTFSTSVPLAGCDGSAPGALTSVSPDRLGTAITDMTVGACKAGIGGSAALTDDVASGQADSSALKGFADGTYDLAYSGIGYGATSPFTTSAKRAYVAVPIAIDAVVLGHVETYSKPSAGNFHEVLTDFPQQLRITDAQAAQLLGGGPTTTAVKWSSSLGQTLLAENPELRTEGFYFSTSLPITEDSQFNKNFGIVATSQATATTYFATSFFHLLAPHSLVSIRTGEPLGATADFGTATPPFDVDSTTTSSLISKALTPNDGQGFALLDGATAASMWGGLADFALQAPSSIGSGSPVFVAPTEASMDAATTEMIPQDDGTLLPNPDATPVNGVQPYPLTFIEYAIAPAQPLMTPTCTPRTSSQQDLTSWLDYVTGPGQSELPAGLDPLTPSLDAQAQAAIAEVGSAKVTGTCAAVKTGKTSPAGSTGAGSTTRGAAASPTTSSGGTSGPGTGAGAGTSAAGTFGPGSLGSTGATGGKGGGASTSPGSAKGHPKGHAVPATLAGFNRAEEPGWLLPALGVLMLVLLLPGLAFLMSGRSLHPEVEGDGGAPGPADPPGGEGPTAGREDG